jgi:hypothetical protein
MVYPYSVKFKGVYYKAGADVPEKDDSVGVVDNAIPFLEESNPEPKTYTKTEINRMAIAELKELAESVGIENAKETSGAKLKEKLIEYYGL